MNSSATQLLLDCLANPTGQAGQLASLPHEGWNQLAGLADMHDVAPFLYYRLRQQKIEPPPEIAHQLKQAYHKNTLLMLRYSGRLHKLLSLMKDQQIRVIVLKGAYLAAAVYDNLGLRKMSDIDLLVKEKDLQRLDQALLAAGCHPLDSNRVIDQNTHHFRYLLPGGPVVEIHWSIVDEKYPVRIDLENLWERAQQANLAQAQALTLAPADLLLHLCLHTATHAYEMRIRMLCDIHEVLRRHGPGVDWQEIGSRARQWGAVRAMYVIFRLARELLGSPIPADWLESFRPENFNEGYYDLARAQIIKERPGPDPAHPESVTLMVLSQLWGPKGLGSKLKLLGRRLLPPRATMARLYPAPAQSWKIYLFYPVHIKNIVARRGAALLKLGRGDPKARAAAERTNQLTDLRDWLMAG